MRSKSPILVAVFTLLVLSGSSAFAGILEPRPVQVTPNDEFGGVGNADYFAWTLDTPRGSDAVKVRVRPTSGSEFSLNDEGRWFVGGMNETGSLLSYYRVTGSRNLTSDVHLYDMAARSRVGVPDGVNTAKFEYFPALSGNSMIFVRRGRVSATLWLIPDRSTGEKFEIKTVDSDRAFFSNAPNLLGNWLTYSLCRQAGCEAYRYDIGLRNTVTVPHETGTYSFAPSADLAGNVYFEQSGRYCGAHAKLMKWTGTGQPSMFYSFDPGRDMNGTSVYDDGAGSVTVYADVFGCNRTNQNIVSFANP